MGTAVSRRKIQIFSENISRPASTYTFCCILLGFFCFGQNGLARSLKCTAIQDILDFFGTNGTVSKDCAYCNTQCIFVSLKQFMALLRGFLMIVFMRLWNAYIMHAPILKVILTFKSDGKKRLGNYKKLNRWRILAWVAIYLWCIDFIKESHHLIEKIYIT